MNLSSLGTSVAPVVPVLFGLNGVCGRSSLIIGFVSAGCFRLAGVFQASCDVLTQTPAELQCANREQSALAAVWMFWHFADFSLLTQPWKQEQRWKKGNI